MDRLAMRLAWIAAAALALAGRACAQEAAPGATIWRVCVSDAVVPPFLTNDAARPGIVDRILMAAGRELGMSTLILRYPTQRCRKMMAEGSLDAQLLSPTPMNLAAFQFPMKDGVADNARRIGVVNFVWVKRSGSPYDWDGSRFSGGAPVDITVGTRAAVLAAIEPLQRLGFKVDSSATSAHQLLMKLDRKRVDLAVSLQGEIELNIQDPQLGDLVVLPKALATAVYFMAVRKDLPARTQEMVEAWWSAIARARDRPELRVN